MPKKILVVDDERHIAHLIKVNLERAGYNVVMAIGGLKGWQALQDEKPDLLILNDCMPDIDGYKVMERKKTAPEFKDIPVIMLLDKGSDEQFSRFWNAGADCILGKPFNPLELLNFVKRIFTSIEEESA